MGIESSPLSYQSVADTIQTTLKEASPLYNLATRFNAPGEILVPVFADDSEAEYFGLGVPLADTSQCNQVKLGAYPIGKIVSMPRGCRDLQGFSIYAHLLELGALKLTERIEKEILLGTSGKISGVLPNARALAAPSVSLDTLAQLRAMVPHFYRANACWIMHPSLLVGLRALKDTAARPLLDPVAGDMLMGNPVYTSEHMPTEKEGAIPVLYGDMSGIGVKVANLQAQELTFEGSLLKLSILVSADCDSNIIAPQKLAALKIETPSQQNQETH